eukprot:jgi/Mesvir1/15563/Mv03195-RA.1
MLSFYGIMGGAAPPLSGCPVDPSCAAACSVWFAKNGSGIEHADAPRSNVHLGQGPPRLLHVCALATAFDNAWHMLYLHGDNNLEQFALEDVEELYQGFHAARANTSQYLVFVLIDRAAGYSSDGFPHDIRRLSNGQYVAVDSAFTNTKLLVLRSGFWEQLEDWGEADMDAPATLTRFMNKCFSLVPVRATVILQLWDHGGGYMGFGGDLANGNSGMGLTVMKNAIAASLSANGVAKLDLLGFDACLMASYTVLEVLNPICRWALASEDLEPGAGWDYRVLNTAAASIQAWAQTMINAFIVHPTASPGDGPRVLALVDMARYEKYQGDMVAMLAALTNWTLAGNELFMTAVSRARAASDTIKMSGDENQELVDIGSLMRHLVAEFDAKLECGELFSSLKSVVETAHASYNALIAYYKSDRPGAQASQYSGMHMFFPERAAKSQANLWFRLYDTTNWAVLPGLKALKDFLTAHYDDAIAVRRGTTCGAEEVFTSPNVTTDSFYVANPVVRRPPGILISGTTPDTVVSGKFYFGMKSLIEDDYYWGGFSSVKITDDGYPTTSIVSGYWDGYLSQVIQERAANDPRAPDPDSPDRYYCEPYFQQELSDTDADGYIDRETEIFPLLYFPRSHPLTNDDLNSTDYDPRSDDAMRSAFLSVEIDYMTESFSWHLYVETGAGTLSEVAKEAGGKLVALQMYSKEYDAAEFNISWCGSYFVWGDPEAPEQDVGELDIRFLNVFSDKFVADLGLESIVVDMDLEPVRGQMASVQAIVATDNDTGLLAPAQMICWVSDLCYTDVPVSSDYGVLPPPPVSPPLPSPAPPPPSPPPLRPTGGDSIADAWAIPFLDGINKSLSLPASTSSLRDTYVAPCSSRTGGRDMIFSYTPRIGQTVRFDTCVSAFDTILQVMLANRTSLACNDDGAGDLACGADHSIGSAVRLRMEANVTYYIMVDGYDVNQHGSFELQVHVDAQDGDVMEDAVPIPLLAGVGAKLTMRGDTSGYNHDYSPWCADSLSTPDMVFKYTPAQGQTLSFDTCQTTFDTVMYMMLPDGTRVACNDDYTGGTGGLCETSRGSRLSDIHLETGETYYVIVDGYGDQSGAFVLNVSVSAEDVPCTECWCQDPNACGDGCEPAVACYPIFDDCWVYSADREACEAADSSNCTFDPILNQCMAFNHSCYDAGSEECNSALLSYDYAAWSGEGANARKKMRMSMHHRRLSGVSHDANSHDSKSYAVESHDTGLNARAGDLGKKARRLTSVFDICTVKPSCMDIQPVNCTECNACEFLAKYFDASGIEQVSLALPMACRDVLSATEYDVHFICNKVFDAVSSLGASALADPFGFCSSAGLCDGRKCKSCFGDGCSCLRGEDTCPGPHLDNKDRLVDQCQLNKTCDVSEAPCQGLLRTPCEGTAGCVWNTGAAACGVNAANNPCKKVVNPEQCLEYEDKGWKCAWTSESEWPPSGFDPNVHQYFITLQNDLVDLSMQATWFYDGATVQAFGPGTTADGLPVTSGVNVTLSPFLVGFTMAFLTSTGTDPTGTATVTYAFNVTRLGSPTTVTARFDGWSYQEFVNDTGAQEQLRSDLAVAYDVQTEQVQFQNFSEGSVIAKYIISPLVPLPRETFTSANASADIDAAAEALAQAKAAEVAHRVAGAGSRLAVNVAGFPPATQRVESMEAAPVRPPAGGTQIHYALSLETRRVAKHKFLHGSVLSSHCTWVVYTTVFSCRQTTEKVILDALRLS